MKTIKKVEIKYPGERITQARVLENGSCELVVETVVNEEVEFMEQQMDTFEKSWEDIFIFVLVEASKLSLEDEFMKHEPKTKREEKFKELLTRVIQKGIKDFYRPKYDPSFNKYGTSVTFKAGNKPALGKSYDWWKKVAKKFMPNRQSRLGTKSEYVAFLGVLIKKLVEEKKWSIAKAWDAVCNDSNELGHYRNSKDAKRDFEDTGMREICGFFDLANTCKILAEDEDDYIGVFLLAGGLYYGDGYDYPLADLYRSTDRNFGHSNSVGWLVFS